MPSRRNSGFDATPTCSIAAPASARIRWTSRVEPTGTVDLLTTTVPAAQHRRDLAGDVLDEREVGRAVVALRRLHAEEHELGDRRGRVAAPTTNAQPAATRAPRRPARAGRPRGSGPRPWRARRPARRRCRRTATSWPRCARQAAVVSPTYPAPMTATSLMCRSPLRAPASQPVGGRGALRAPSGPEQSGNSTASGPANVRSGDGRPDQQPSAGDRRRRGGLARLRRLRGLVVVVVARSFFVSFLTPLKSLAE